MSKTILITGGSSGIGAACARTTVAAGHRVALAVRSTEKLQELRTELGDENVVAIKCDVTDPDKQKQMFERTVATFGRSDVVFANAGLGASAIGTEHGYIESF